MGQNETDWIPSAKQRKITELLLNFEDRRTKTEKLEAIKVPRSTFYRWLKNKCFLKYINDQLENITDGEVPEVWKALVLKCKRGDTQAIKLFYEMKNMYVDRKEIKIGNKLEDFM